MSAAACTLAPKHKWEWVRDITLVTAKTTSRGTLTKFSLRGEFKCACGGVRHGIARGGL